MANVAREQFFVGVQSCVILQSTLLAKAFATNHTNVRFLLGVNANMALQSTLLDERFVAHFAGEWTFVCVLTCVNNQCLTGGKTLLTIVAFKWFFALSDEIGQAHVVGTQLNDTVRCTVHINISCNWGGISLSCVCIFLDGAG